MHYINFTKIFGRVLMASPTFFTCQLVMASDDCLRQNSTQLEQESVDQILKKLDHAPINPDAEILLTKSDFLKVKIPANSKSSIVLPIGALDIPSVKDSFSLTANDPGTSIAIGGYDPVAYFTQQQATKGSPEFTTIYKGVTYHFASAENRELFLSSADKYAPAYGGYCTETLAAGKITPGDPTNWTIHGNRLYLTKSQKSTKQFRENRAISVLNANKNWELVEAALKRPDPIFRQDVQ